jgi:FkbH-like protein
MNSENIKNNQTNIRTVEQDGRVVKIALLFGSTMKNFEQILRDRCLRCGCAIDTYVGQYNNFAQEILSAAGSLYRYAPEIIFLYIDSRTLFRDLYFDYYTLDRSEQKKLLDDTLTQIDLLLNTLKQKTTGRIVLHNFVVPTATIMGILETKTDFSLQCFFQQLNATLAITYRNDERVFIFDFDQMCGAIGKDRVFNAARYYLADITFDLAFWPQLADEYLGYLIPLANRTKKCVVLDLDNTLWGGIIGEDGLQNIKLGPTGEGRPYYEFQKFLLALFKRGVILAVNSKNNLHDVLTVMHQHPHMILREEHFAARQINWNDKVANLRLLAKEINIGLDSMVFIDDDPLNCEMVAAELPEVTVINLPSDSAQIVSTIIARKEFNLFQLTDEDRNRGAMYASQRQRAQLSESAPDIETYLRQLQLVVTIQGLTDLNLPRLAQLTQKTNQFNMTTKRYTEHDLRQLMQDPQVIVRLVAVKDKFGDNGITGALIMRRNGQQMLIDSFLLSCRIIGRKIENVMLAEALSLTRQTECPELIGEFIATEKNAPAKDFYCQAGFESIKKDEELEKWRWPVNRQFEAPDFITIIR